MSVYYPNIINPNTPNAGGGTVPFTNPMTGALDMGGYEVVNSTEGITSPNSLATVGQVNQLIASNTSSIFCPTATTDLNMNFHKVFNSRSLGLMATSPTSPSLVLSNQGTWDSLLLAISGINGIGMSYVYDTVYNKPPTATSQTLAQICDASQDPTTHIVSAGSNVIGDILELDLKQGLSGLAIGIDPTHGYLRYTTTGWADKFGILYDTQYNKPPSSGGGGWPPTVTAPLDMAGQYILQTDYLELQNQDTFTNGTAGTDLNIQARMINNKPVMTIQKGTTGQGIIYDTLYNPLPAPSGAGISGLAVDPDSKLLCYQGQPLMINQYTTPNTISLSATTSLYFNFSSISLPIATTTVNGNFNDLFNPTLTYQLNFSFSSAEPVASFTNSLSTILTVIILDANGNNILAGAEPVVPVFHFDKRDGLFSYVNNNFVFQATLTPSSVPLYTDYYNMFTQGLNTTAPGPYTINLCISSMVSIQPTPTYFVATSLNTASFEVWDIDMSNPFPVVSNYDLTNGITTIRTSQHGLLIKSYRDRGTSLYTDSLQLIPTYSTTPKTWHGVITGTVAAPDPSVHFIINVNKVPTTPFAYTCILFVYISNTNCVTDNNTGIANPITYTVSAQSSNVVSWVGTNIYPPVITMDPTGFLVNVQHEIPLGSPAFNYTLTYDFISL